jgi:two-component sensor histidine kinase
VSGRILALARSHSLIAASRWRGANVAQIVDAELAPYHSNEGRASDGARVEAVGPPVTLRPAAAQSLAMAIHELTTNAVKHGALSSSDGRISVAWQLTEQGLFLLWDEAGGPPIAGPPERHGFGTKIIAAGIEHQLDGRVTFDSRPEGLLVSISVPSEHLAG